MTIYKDYKLVLSDIEIFIGISHQQFIMIIYWYIVAGHMTVVFGNFVSIYTAHSDTQVL